MQAGLVLKLLDLRDGKVVWGVDHAWDAADQETQNRMKAFFDRHIGEGQAPADWKLGTMSPRAFAKFVSDEIAETLAPPTGPTPPPNGGIRKYVGKLAEQY